MVVVTAHGEFRALSEGERAGAIAMTLFATFSATLVTLLLLHILSVTTAPFFYRAKQDHNEERVFLRMQLGVFVVCLLISDLCNAISGLITGSWAANFAVREGTACTVQAVLLQFGDTGTAMWNTVVAVHTFITVVLSRRMSRTAVAMTVVGGWCTVGFLTMIGPLVLVTPDRGPFYGVAAQWCFVREPYNLERIMVHYLPMFISAFIIMCLYFLVFLTLRGTLVINGKRWRLHWGDNVTQACPTSPSVQTHGTTQLRSLAKKVLWYPIVYICLILPISVCRLVTLDPRNPPIPSAAGQTSMCLLFSMGFANCLIYALTRRIGPTPWFARPARNSRSVQVFIDRVTHNDIEGQEGYTGSGSDSKSSESKLKDFILSGGRLSSKNSFSRKDSFHKKEKPILAISTTAKGRPISLPELDEGTGVALGVIDIPQRPKPVLHLEFRSTTAVALMGSIASFPGQPFVSQHVPINAFADNEDDCSTKSSPRSDGTGLL